MSGAVARSGGRRWHRGLLSPAAASRRRNLLLAADDEPAAGKPYAERLEPTPGTLDRIAEFLVAATIRPLRGLVRNPSAALRIIVREAARHDAALRAATDGELSTLAAAMRARFRDNGFTPDLVGECFALISEAASRTMGMRHYDVQLMAGWGLLQGKLVEMATGEGKTFAAALPAATVALAGYPVHVITVNDYLASRDAAELEPVYRFLGLTVGTVVAGMERPDRAAAYARSIVYTTNKDLAFDYLRDGVALAGWKGTLHLAVERLRRRRSDRPDLVLRGLHFAIVDEADSVFIDEARTPLILSATVAPAEETVVNEQALVLARQLVEETHFTVDPARRLISLEEAGKEHLEAISEELGGIWTSVRAREELVGRALAALILFRRDQHYVVAEGKVQIVDESTGRLMPDRSWERGLHQLVEAKEGCDPTPRRETIARITYQRLFRRFIRLGGMTGTGKEVSPEIRHVYGLDIVRIPLNRPSQRQYRRPRVCLTKAEKLRLIADAVEAVALGAGRPILIGTRSVVASHEVSAILRERGIDHALLNAMQDREEAEIVTRAGQPGAVTVATNMAGRGTDIRLGRGVAESGGLHVVLTEYHESRRLDRQLFGRSGRQGDPGSCEAVVSLEDEIFTTYVPRMTKAVSRLVARGVPGARLAFAALRWFAQSTAEHRGVVARKYNLGEDQRLDRVLAFSGRGE
jgi:preprotein translocase subunit SecA